jgi:O-antigen/teichoic acid export membrane protein
MSSWAQAGQTGTPDTMPQEAPGTCPPPDRPAADEGFRWRIAQNATRTVLVSVLTLPFGPLTSLVLARVSPEAIGTFSLLAIYLSSISCVLYLGGGTVTVRFMTELPRENRLPFFFSYLAVTLATIPLVLAITVVFPSLLQFLVHASTHVRLFRLLLLCAPIPLLYFSALATLRGLMHVAFAQMLVRSLPVATFVLYGYLWLFHDDLLRREYTPLIVGSYFSFLALAAALALARLKNDLLPSANLPWFLPSGFWRFALAVQLPSMLMLLHQKLDQILVLRTLGLAQVGTYYVLVQLAEAPLVLTGFLLEAVFPAMLALYAVNRLREIVTLYREAARYMLLIVSGTTSFLFVFGPSILAFLGPQYTQALPAFFVLLLFESIDALGPLNHTLIIGVRSVNYWTLVQAVRLGIFALLFPFLVQPFGLVGVTVARGCAGITAGSVAYWIVWRRLPVRPALPVQYPLHFAMTLTLAAVACTRGDTSGFWVSNVALFCGAVGAFALCGGYRAIELKRLYAFLRQSPECSSELGHLGSGRLSAQRDEEHS